MLRSLVLFLLTPLGLAAQEVEAPYAQYLATQTMAAHPELKKIGIHAVPPGKSDSQIVGSNIPSKLGKKSSAADMAVVESDKPSVARKDGFFDLALPLADNARQRVGLLVMELLSTQAKDQEEALAKASAIRDEVARQIDGKKELFGSLPAYASLALLRTVPLPNITGDFDHFAVDVEHNRLYVSAEQHHSIEVFNLRTGEHLKSAPGVTTPHTLAFEPTGNRLLVADGGDSSCRILDAGDLHQIARVPLAAGSDAAVYDPQQHLFYVGNGGRPANLDYSFISVVDAATAKEVRKIRIDSANLEAMALEPQARLLYVNMRDKAQVAVVDLEKGEVRQTWTVPGLTGNTPLVLDILNHRLFLAGRKPGKFFVINIQNGSTVATLPAVETADDMTFDAVRGRIYVTGAGGVTVIEQQSPDRYRTITQFPTNSGKTSVYVPQLEQFYIIHTKTEEDAAALQVYKVQ